MPLFKSKKEKKADIILLAAYSKKTRVIGKEGKIPWKLKGERELFKEVTAHKKIIMGRKTFEEIGKPLPYCTIIVVSKSLDSVPQGCLLARSFEEAVKLSDGAVLVAGGQSLYEEVLPVATKIYATEILEDYQGDRFFPPLDGLWRRYLLEEKCENNIRYEYVLYKRIK